MNHQEAINKLREIYHTPGTAYYLATPKVLHKLFKNVLTLEDIKKQLNAESTYTRFRRRRLKFPRNKYWLGHIAYARQSDIMEIPKLAKQNDGHK